MNTNTILYTMDKQARKQLVFFCLLLLPFVLFTLSGFTFIPNTSQTLNLATGGTSSITSQTSALHTGYIADDSCTDIIFPVQFSLSEIKIYLNVCALGHLSALAQGAGAGAAVLAFVSVWCEECIPLAAGATAIVAGAIAGIGFLQYNSKGCGGVFIDISWDGGVQFEPACTPQDNGS